MTTTASDLLTPDEITKMVKACKRHKDGSWRYLESTASANPTPEGKVEHLVIVNRDVTARRELERQFLQAQKMEAVGRLSGGIAHDFNNLLGVIIGYSEVMQEQLEPNQPLRTCVDEVLGAARRAAELNSMSKSATKVVPA